MNTLGFSYKTEQIGYMGLVSEPITYTKICGYTSLLYTMAQC